MFEFVLALVGVVVWGIRLEGRVNNLHTLRGGDLRLAKEQRMLDKQLQDERMERIDESLNEIKTTLKEVATLTRKVDKLGSFLGGHFSSNGPQS
jgi:hypothetical protein